ncbi:MAG: UDP-N-acetylmuramoyl-L-alanyl-D-glutamate--2,6-diaminopimelate ligase [Oscillospiraceae bacterium]
MKLIALLKDIDVIEMHAQPETEIADVFYDSRAVKPDGLFVAIRGFEADGHLYIPAALEKGAVCVICEQPPEAEIPYVLVRDSRAALALASRNLFGDPSAELCVIGVTGTNGKTTTTQLLKHLLEFCLSAKVGLVGTNGNMIGDELLPTERTTPESYELQKLFRQMAEAGCTHVVMEVSSHSLALERVAGIKFAVGVFTNLTQDHLDFHKDMEDYARAKAKLFPMCEHCAVNLDDDWSGFMSESSRSPVFTFSEKHNEANLVAKDIRLSVSGVKFCVLLGNELQRVSLGIPGLFSVYNALGVIACASLLGIPLPQCAEALASAKGVKGRVEVVPTDGDYTILIDYAHTPDALENVLRSMRAVAQGRVVVLFGCGGDRDRTKRPKMGRIAADNADFVIVTSDNPRTEAPEAIISEIVEGMKGTKTHRKVITGRPQAIEWAIENHRAGDLIILAGKGHEDYQIVGKTKHHMDEREIVAEILEKRKINQ